MSAIIEIMPSITDTEEDRARMLKDAQDFSRDGMEEDDFLVFPDEEEKQEVLEESNSVFNIDGKNIEFTYISSINKNGVFASFAQDAYGLWWWFIRTGISTGKDLKGPFTTKEKLIKSMGVLYA